ncbi:MAG: hypothetical protein RLZZ574_1787 [Cyanobacteriota bacterium]|jgi:hypothetical protein
MLDVGVNKLALACLLLTNDGFLNDAVSAIFMFNPKRKIDNYTTVDSFL